MIKQDTMFLTLVGIFTLGMFIVEIKKKKVKEKYILFEDILNSLNEDYKNDSNKVFLRYNKII